MSDMKLGAIESRFADLIWQNEPMTPGELVKLAAEELNWKRTTTYTVLKRLCERGLFQKEERVITALISREEFYARQSERFVEDTFDGSRPAFLTAFARRRKLSPEEIEELKKVIGEMEQ